MYYTALSWPSRYKYRYVYIVGTYIGIHIGTYIGTFTYNIYIYIYMCITYIGIHIGTYIGTYIDMSHISEGGPMLGHLGLLLGSLVPVAGLVYRRFTYRYIYWYPYICLTSRHISCTC